ncbi:hypothetical protein D3C77_774610 [compost metagenome]
MGSFDDSADTILKMSRMRSGGGVEMIWERYKKRMKSFFMKPDFAFLRSQTISKKVVFPDPLGPRMPTMSP